MEGIFLVNLLPARILFDLGASHSFFSHACMLAFHIILEVLEDPLSVVTPWETSPYLILSVGSV